MNFLFPLYLLGIAAVAIPVILHLRRRPPKERTEFSSLMFLAASPIERKRRRKLENLLLLLLRCALICLLAFLFARPLLRSSALLDGGGEGRFTVILLDRSASMRREDLWERGVAAAREAAEAASPRDRIAVVSFDSETVVHVGFERWEEEAPGRRGDLVATELGGLDAGWGGTDLGSAIATAVEMIEEARNSARGDEETGSAPGSGARGEVVLISDLQEGSDRRALEVVGWPNSIELAVEILEPRAIGNASLNLLTSENIIMLREANSNGETEEGEAGADDDEGGIRLRLSNGPTSLVGDFEVAWSEGGGAPTSMTLAPGRQRTFRLDVPDGAEVLSVTGDEHDFDNRVFVAREAPRPMRVLWLAEDESDEEAGDASGPFFYLERVLQATNLHAPFVSREWPGDGNLKAAVDILVIGGEVSKGRWEEIGEYVAGGGATLVVLRSPLQAAMLSDLVGSEVAVEEAEVDGDYVLLEDIAFEDSLLGAFADPRLRDFSKIHFWNYRRLQPAGEWPEGARVLARFDSGDVAWVTIPSGEGELVVFASSWNPVDSQLGLSTKFVPLMYSLLEGGEQSDRVGGEFVVGSALPVGGGEAATVRRPDGKVEAVGKDGYYRATDLPGIYRAAGPKGEFSFAVNLDHRESRTEVMELDELRAAGVVVAGLEGEAGAVEGEPEKSSARQGYLLDTEREKKQQLWRWLVIGAIVTVFLEMLIAGRGTQPRAGEAV